MKLIDELTREGILSTHQRRQLLTLAAEWGVAPGSLVRTLDLVDPATFLCAYTRATGIEAPDTTGALWNHRLAGNRPLEEWSARMALPVLMPDGRDMVLAVDPEALAGEYATATPPVALGLILEEEWVELTGRLCGQGLLHESVHGLRERRPDLSAQETFTRGQIFAFWLVATATCLGLWFFPLWTMIVANVILNTFFFVCVAFKSVLALVGASRETAHKVSAAEVLALNNAELPIYTIMVPVYKEPTVIPHIVNHLSHLDYPLSKLDVLVLLEQDDKETIDAFRSAHAPPNFHAIIVPPAQPKTKPKACNYGLPLARGAFLTIYDAEDLPEPDQLKKVIAAFRKFPPSTMCIQAALNYFNWNENMLTRMFTLEYSHWFDYVLPGMEALKVPIPLGGTSNHFVTSRLRELNGWDPFNVTEDADLGVRATGLGYTVLTIDSTTFEEANRAYGNWIRQRSRWIKGYMQTFLVHSRRPHALIKEIGLKGFFGFVLFIGGTPFIFLVNPILWLIFFYWLLTDTNSFSTWYPGWLLALSFFNLLIGNFMAVYINVLGVFKRRNYGLAPFALLNPVYWVMHSIAAYRGLYQLLVKPFYWEKTDHGLTNVRAAMPVARP